MSLKAFILLIIILTAGLFIFLKLEAMGGPNSHFNQTTRYKLGKSAFWRTVLGLHSAGDERAEYFGGKGPIVIQWYKAESDQDINGDQVQQLADAVTKYTGRQTIVQGPGPLDDGTVDLTSLASLKLQKATLPVDGGDVLLVIFAEDYNPRPNGELSRTYQESGMVISLNAHRQFVSNNSDLFNKYLLGSMLHEFGNQIGLPEQGSDPACLMNLHAGINGQPLEAQAYSEPQDFCPTEVDEINQLKAQY